MKYKNNNLKIMINKKLIMNFSKNFNIMINYARFIFLLQINQLKLTNILKKMMSIF